MPKKPSTIVSTLISSAIDKLAPRMTQRELAVAMGFSTPNMLSMLRTGDAKVPFTKIPVIAAVLDIDPALLFRFHLREQWPEFEEVVFEIFGGVLTRAEREWIEFFNDLDIKLPATAVKRKELKNLLRGFGVKSS
ncbi:MAG: helix-turn-helix transcriptional regulator [Aestuariivirga sp.]